MTQGANVCPVCLAPGGQRVGTVNGYSLWRCAACGVRFHPRPSTSMTYDGAYFGRHGESGPGYADYEATAWYPRRVYADLRSELLLRFPDRGRLLEIGCATGPFVEAALTDGWTAEGIDVAAAAVDHGVRRGLPLRAVALEDVGYADASFDVVVMLHVLEHLQDPIATLTEARRLTAAGGCLVVEVPNGSCAEARVRGLRWSALTPPEHLTYFDRRSLEGLLRRTEWRPLSSTTPTSAGLVAVRLGGDGTVGSMSRVAVRVANGLGVFRAIARAGLGGSLRTLAVTA